MNCGFAKYKNWNFLGHQLLCHLKEFALSSNPLIIDTQSHPYVCDCLAPLMIVTADQIRNGSVAAFWLSQSIQLRLTFQIWGENDKSVVFIFLSFTFVLLLICPWKKAGHPVIFGRIYKKIKQNTIFSFFCSIHLEKTNMISHSCIENHLNELNKCLHETIQVS